MKALAICRRKSVSEKLCSKPATCRLFQLPIDAPELHRPALAKHPDYAKRRMQNAGRTPIRASITHD